VTTTTTDRSDRTSRPYDPSDVSSLSFWSATAAEREVTYALFRAERPISWHRPAEGSLFEDPNDQGCWAVTRHADLVEVTKRHGDFLSGEGIVMDSLPQELLDAAQGFIAMDPPRHTKIRRLLVSAFTPKQISRINDQIEANSRRIVAEIAEKGEVDFVAEVAALVPMHNICDMMGVPDDVREKVAHEASFAGGWHDPELMGGADPLTRLFEAALYLREAAGDIIAVRRRDPGADLLTALVHAEIDGERLTDDEIVSFFGLLTVAGNDTTRQSTSHAMKALSDHPDQRAWLMADFEPRIAGSVEEMVRWATPIMTFRRTAARDCTLGDIAITEGDKVVMFYASANWDTEVFTDPERFDLSRNPNPHVGFGGGGIHHCLGNQLARRQLASIWRELLHTLPDVEVSGPPSFTVGNFFHGVNHLPVSFTPTRVRA